MGGSGVNQRGASMKPAASDDVFPSLRSEGIITLLSGPLDSPPHRSYLSETVQEGVL